MKAGPPLRVFTFDATPLKRFDPKQPDQVAMVWDQMHVLAALQGLVNRESPGFFLNYCREFGVDTDQFWFDWLQREDGWLKSAKVQPLPDWGACVNQFRPVLRGLVVYDPQVPATANLASTAAGCDNLLPVRFDPRPGSVFDILTRRFALPVQLWLVHSNGTSLFTGKGSVPGLNQPSSGSSKVDAYRWGIAHYLHTGKCNSRLAAYYIDSFWIQSAGHAAPDLHTLSNHDYPIANKAFFFDLSPWGDEAPNDDLSQPPGADRQGFLSVMRALYTQGQGDVLKICGFIPWPFKYTDSAAKTCRHAGVPTEWEFGRLISQFNGYMEADAASLSSLANASFYQHYPLARRYPQPNSPPRFETWKTRGWVTSSGRVTNLLFLAHYVGDYDSPAWLYKAVPAFFRDPTRGQVPLGWAINPNLADRVPQVLVYAYRHATTNDYFVAGDSGAGYLNPRALTVRPDSGLPSGLDAWTLHCQKYYQQWGLSITGFVLDGSGGQSTPQEWSAYRKFSPDGLGTHFEPKPAQLATISTCPETDLPDDVDTAAKAIIARAAKVRQGPQFCWARSILKSPRWYADLSARLRQNQPAVPVEVVDPYTFFALIRLSQSQPVP